MENNRSEIMPYPDYAEEDQMGYDGDASNFVLINGPEMRTAAPQEDGDEIDIPAIVAGRGWFDSRIAAVRTGIDLSTAAFSDVPRNWDNCPNTSHRIIPFERSKKFSTMRRQTQVSASRCIG
jgi:hypothetical protein